LHEKKSARNLTPSRESYKQDVVFRQALPLLLVSLVVTGCASTAQKDVIQDPNSGSFDQHVTAHISNLPQFPEGLTVGYPGFCKSPYAPMAGLVDVRGYATDAKVICPYTGKIFTVPAFGTKVDQPMDQGQAGPSTDPSAADASGGMTP
jgi:hypothetical protein